MIGILRPAEADEYWFEEGCFILELSNSSADPELSIARARVPAGGRTRWHRLTATTERYLVLEGTGLLGRGDEEIPLQAGDTAIIPPGVRQRITNTGAGDLVFLALCTPRFIEANYVGLDDEPSA